MRRIILLALFGFALGAPSERSSDSCSVCVLLVDEVRALISSHETQASVLDYVTGACSNLDGLAKDVCRAVTDQYSDKLFQAIDTQLDSRSFCQQLPEVCPSEKSDPQPVAEQPVAPAEEEEDEVEEQKLEANPIECELCKLAVIAVDRLIKTNKSDAAINETLEKLCDSLPASISSLCKELEPKILDAIKNGLNPDESCKFVKLCDGVSASGLTCDTCLELLDAAGLQDPRSACVELTSCAEEAREEAPVLEMPEPMSNTVIQPEPERIETEVEDTLECQLCKFAVQAIDKLVGENKTAANINQTLYDLCNGLPGELKDVCLSAEPEILKAILGGVDPTKACDFIKLCHDSKSSRLNPALIPCDACKETLENMAGERGVSICSQLTDICEPPAAEDNMTGLSKVEQIGDDAKCELCKFAITLLDQIIESNDSLPKINATLYEICKALPKDLQILCTQLIPQIEKIIETGLDPTNSCIAVGFCTEENGAKVTEMNQELATQVLDQLSQHTRSRRSLEDHMEYWQYLASELQQFVGDDDKADASFLGCEVCKVVIRLVDEITGQNASIGTVNSTLQEICNRLTGQQLVDICLQETPKLLAFMKDGIEPTQVCQAAKMCDKVASDELDTAVDETEPVEISEDVTPDLYSILYAKGMKDEDKVDNPNDIKCELCEELVKLVDSVLEKNASIEKINSTLHQVCSGLPNEAFKDICLSLIPEILKTLEGGLDPKEACTLAKICTGNAFNVKEREEKKEELELMSEPNDLKCELCKELVQFVDSRLQDNVTIEKLNQTLYQVCSGIPDDTLKTMCTALVPEIMKAAESGGWDPEKLCESVGICDAGKKPKQSKRTLIKFDDAQQKKVGNLKDLKCEICKAVIDEVDYVLGENATIDKVNATIYDVCGKLQGALQDICLQAAPQLVKAISQGVDYKTACSFIGLCPKSIQDAVRALENEVTSPLLCDACARTVQLVYEDLDKDYPKIKPVITALCNSLHPQYKAKCGALVEKDNGFYFKLFLETLNPEVLCTAIQCQ